MRRPGWPVAVILICMLLGYGLARWLVWARLSRQVIAGGSELPIETEAVFFEALDRLEARLLGDAIQLVADQDSWDFVGSELGVHLDRVGMWRDVVGRPPEGYVAFLLHTAQPRNLPMRLIYDEAALNERLALVGQEIWRAPKNARLDPVTKEIVQEENGQALDIIATRARLLDGWRTGERRVLAVIRSVPPATTANPLRNLGLKHILARFSSYFDPAQEGRVDNIRMAASLLDGTLLLPGEVFSFNTVVGPRSLERGFRVAPEIVNQEMVSGVGGGVCQVSSTLYNAALLSGLEIVERRHHSRPLGYIGVGRDATVFYGVIDFRFTNPHPFPILLSSEVVENRVTIAVWAPGSLPASYAVITEEPERLPAGTVIENDPLLPIGESVILKEGQPGWRVSTWLAVLGPDGSEMWREPISFDVYPPQPSVQRQNLAEPSLSRTVSTL